MPAEEPHHEQLVFDSMHEFRERLECFGAFADNRVRALFSPISSLVFDAAQLTQSAAREEAGSVPPHTQRHIEALRKDINEIVALVTAWWSWEPFFADGGPMRDYGLYEDDYAQPLRDVLADIADGLARAHGQPWDMRRDPGIAGMKWWHNDDESAEDFENPMPEWALWFDGVEWRDYGERDLPCTGLRCTVADISPSEHQMWCEKLRTVVRSRFAD